MADAVERHAAAAAAIGAAAARDYPRLWAAEAIPPALWSAMAEAGLLGLSTAERYGGAGLSTDEIARVGRAFVRASGVQGLVTAWQAHNLMADWVFGHFASEGQRQAWSPRIAAGAASVAFAVSEPGAGAHPKRLSARAELEGDGYRLTGKKAYVTNGPIASVFAIVAVVDEDANGRKSYGAFLVPADAPGLKILPSEHVDFLKPSGHASLELDGVFAPAMARLTSAADVYPIMVMPLRDHEDAAGAWTRLGAYERLAEALATTPDLAGKAGAIWARLRAVETVLENDAGGAGLLGARAILQDVARETEAVLAETPDALTEADSALARDLQKLGGVARYAVEARFAALGRRLAQLRPDAAHASS